MRKFRNVTFLFGFLLLFSGCGNNSSSSDSTVTLSPSDGDAYISEIPDDTVPVSNLAVVPHHKNEIPLLVILLEYDNQTVVSSETVWHDKIFGYGQKELNGYFTEVSGGKFHYAPAAETYGIADNGVIRVKLAKDHPNTAVEARNFYDVLTSDLQASIAASDPYVDFSRFDADADGYLTPDELTVIYVVAGYEDAFEGEHVTNGIWAHQSSLADTDAPRADGVVLFSQAKNGKYAVFGERHNLQNPHDATIGIIAHELGHATFSLPDLYNPLASYGGIGYFGLMGAGAWTTKDTNEFPGDTPTHFCAWSKTFLGWVTPQEYANTSVSLTQSASPQYNVVKIPISANHYYLLENRNNDGYDRGLHDLEGDFQGGIAIWHIDQTKLTTDYFNFNTVNADTLHKGVDLVEAVDPMIDYFPNYGGNVKALFFNPNRTSFGDKIDNISDVGTVMTLDIH